MSKLDDDYNKIVTYVDTAAQLAESVYKDVQNGKKISSDTVLALSKFAAASQRVAFFLDKLEAMKVKLN